MAAGIRPDKKCMKIAYNILKTAKDKRQKNEPCPNLKLRKVWSVDSGLAQ